MRRFIIVILLFLASGHAHSQNQSQKNIMQNLATLAIANQWCDEYKIDTKGSAAIAVMAQIDVRKEPYQSYFDGQKETYEAMMGKYGIEAYCATAYKRFGPGGSIGGLMMKR